MLLRAAQSSGIGLIGTDFGALYEHYQYGPFGEVLRATGPMARANPFRFSTSYQDDETDLVYYGYRYYNASTGRWISRDPLNQIHDEANRFHALKSPGIRGDLARVMADSRSQLMDYTFVLNEPRAMFDAYGLQVFVMPLVTCCLPVPVRSGPGSLPWYALFQTIGHHPPIGLGHTPIPAIRDTLTITCPSSAPFLISWGLTALYMPYTPNHPFPGDWSGFPSGGPGTYTIQIEVPSSPIYAGDPELSKMYLVGLCSCASLPLTRQNPPPPPNRPPPNSTPSFPVQGF